ncbi:Serine/threonine-protein kinase csk1 [Tolypocladium ophioglossoides CBS 100239]|uniref:cyclin-dependent kinase n=1 Tax=Tolypocladium ophioglossoides (strain CBS 100239) TaxID=1163406 RepID=A0A0L0NFD0_TOLOC|nr:Serine/threonine-protein kinase csk1 [Tolypocladium ophioglossoides CBS 100239]
MAMGNRGGRGRGRGRGRVREVVNMDDAGAAWPEPTECCPVAVKWRSREQLGAVSVSEKPRRYSTDLPATSSLQLPCSARRAHSHQLHRHGVLIRVEIVPLGAGSDEITSIGSEPSLTVDDRQAYLPAHAASEAIAIEQQAYQTASTRASQPYPAPFMSQMPRLTSSQEEYEAACKQSNDASTDTQPGSSNLPRNNTTAAENGIRIGPYTNCTPISDGVTSEVYRCADRALKVIVTHRNLEPHNPRREAKILAALRPPCIPLLDVFHDHEQRLVLAFPFMPLTLADLLDRNGGGGGLSGRQIRAVFTDVLRALGAIHAQGIVHRDVKPSAVLLQSAAGPAFLSDFGTAWHPELSVHSEPAGDKILDIGTGPYRAPEVLFGDKAYGPPVDMLGLGVMLAEALGSPLFESRPVDEDGNQLGLILSIFKTLGTPTPETWPEARGFKVSPFELWTVFTPRPWEVILPDVDAAFRDVVAALVRYDSRRASAAEALKFPCLAVDEAGLSTPEV